MPRAFGFLNDSRWTEHFDEHRSEFGVTTKDEYLARAKAFLEADLNKNPNIQECTRSNNDIMRLDVSTDEFAIVSPSGIIKTYFKPQPRATAPPGTPLHKTHGHPDNLSYFRSECGK